MKVVDMSENMELMPVKDGLCPVCAVDHDPALPHNPQSLYYQVSFMMKHKREPTWKDALEHCGDEMKQAWTAELKAKGIEV